jgi:hypothetical protein
MSQAKDLGPADEIEVIETVEFSDSDGEDPTSYAAIEMSDDDEDSDEDLVAALTSLQKTTRGTPGSKAALAPEPKEQTEVRPSVVDVSGAGGRGEWPGNTDRGVTSRAGTSC